MAMLRAHAGTWTDDLLERLDPEGEVARGLERQIRAYLDLSQCRGKRLLDFGCGVGASSLALARLLPDTDIVGVELNPEQVALGNHLRNIHQLPNLRFIASPAGDQLPPALGVFHYITLSAVYEHLLPVERRTIMPLLWRALEPGGMLFISGTPHRWFPVEHHTTGLWGLNYLPRSVALPLARRWGKSPGTAGWAAYLRAGIRGGTEREMRRNCGDEPVIAQPLNGDRAGYWLSGVSPRHRTIKRTLARIFRITDRFFDTIPSTHVEVVFKKP